jgi:hypothetical protein
VHPRIAIVHIHKTGGTTLSGVLKSSFGGRHCLVSAEDPEAPFFSADDLRRLRRFYPFIRSIMGHDIRTYGDLDAAAPGLTYITMLRDPLVRCASHYQYDVQRGGIDIPFEEWITHDVSPNRQTRHLAGPGASAADAIGVLEERVGFVGLVERYDESLVMMRRALGLREIRYARKWTAPSDDIKRRLLEDPRSRDLLVEANREDLEVYRHSLEVMFPRQVAAYGADLEGDVAAFREVNRGVNRWRMYARPRYAWYVAKWRLLYDPWVRRRRRLALQNSVAPVSEVLRGR